jgi:hypothetical protein
LRKDFLQEASHIVAVAVDQAFRLQVKAQQVDLKVVRLVAVVNLQVQVVLNLPVPVSQALQVNHLVIVALVG